MAQKFQNVFLKGLIWNDKTKLNLDQLEEKSKHLLVPENCPKPSVPLINKEVFSQLSNTHKTADLWLRNLQYSTSNYSPGPSHQQFATRETKAMIKNNLDAISLMGHSLQDISTISRRKIKSFLNRTCVSLCDLEYTDTQLFLHNGAMA